MVDKLLVEKFSFILFRPELYHNDDNFVMRRSFSVARLLVAARITKVDANDEVVELQLELQAFRTSPLRAT